MASTPAISVIMPLYRSQEFLKESIDSIIRQSFNDFEFLIIVDNASEATVSILDEYVKADSRIKVYYNDDMGLINSLNMGFKAAKGKYIVRMDSDDICLPTRLEKQFLYMEEHPEIGILGTSYEIIDGNGNTTNIYHPINNPKLIKWRLIYDNCLTHSSVIIRSNILGKTGYYRSNAKYAEDYDLWARASHITNISNYRDVLIKYRIHDESVSTTRFEDQHKTVLKIIYANISGLLDYDITMENVADLRKVVTGKRLNDSGKINTSIKILSDLYRLFIRNNQLKPGEIGLVTNDLAIKIFKTAIKEKQLPVFSRVRLCYDAVMLKLRSYDAILKHQF